MLHPQTDIEGHMQPDSLDEAEEARLQVSESVRGPGEERLRRYYQRPGAFNEKPYFQQVRL